jgi:hypothetical protein
MRQQQQQQQDQRRCCGCIGRTWCTVLLVALVLTLLCAGGAGLWVWLRGRRATPVAQGGCSGSQCASAPPPAGSQLQSGEQGRRHKHGAVDCDSLQVQRASASGKPQAPLMQVASPN